MGECSRLAFFVLTFSVNSFRINRGRGRVIPKQRLEGVKLHRTVRLRMEMKEEEGEAYRPRAKLIPGIEPIWID